mmetsp:Transcript_8608/g.18632  ORF Transcript_8608/g.18632 Transcript_8608/m.18632 type:complete len:225 (-) Transcript_8608:61-735(-)
MLTAGRSRGGGGAPDDFVLLVGAGLRPPRRTVVKPRPSDDCDRRMGPPPGRFCSCDAVLRGADLPAGGAGGPRMRLSCDLLKRCKSSLVALRDTAGIPALSPEAELASSGLQFKHRPLSTLPCSVMGVILKSFFWKHFRPHVTHSPRLSRYSLSCAGVMTDPVAWKSVPRRSIPSMMIVCVSRFSCQNCVVVVVAVVVCCCPDSNGWQSIRGWKMTQRSQVLFC